MTHVVKCHLHRSSPFPSPFTSHPAATRRCTSWRTRDLRGYAESEGSSQTAQAGGSSRRAALLAQLSSLALLGGVPASQAADRKSSEELRDTIAHDFQHNQYYVTGNLSREIFTKDCVFQDPTTRVQGVEKYSKAVALLFDKDTSRADLISIKIQDPHTITTRWRFAASLNVPGKPKLKPYTGSTQYRINDDGLIYEHEEEWDISALDAFVSILFPSFGAAPAPPVANPVDI